MTSARKLLANRNNALRSTGPKTPSGKAASAMNAVVHGLFARVAVVGLLGETEADFEAVRSAVVGHLDPRTGFEAVLAEQAAAVVWRLARAARYEAAVGGIALRPAEDLPTDPAGAAPDPAPSCSDEGALRDRLGELARDRAALAGVRAAAAAGRGGPPPAAVVPNWEAGEGLALACRAAGVDPAGPLARQLWPPTLRGMNVVAADFFGWVDAVAAAGGKPAMEVGAAVAAGLAPRIEVAAARVAAGERAARAIAARIACRKAAGFAESGALKWAEAAVERAWRYERHLTHQLKETLALLAAARRPVAGGGDADDPGGGGGAWVRVFASPALGEDSAEAADASAPGPGGDPAGLVVPKLASIRTDDPPAADPPPPGPPVASPPAPASGAGAGVVSVTGPAPPAAAEAATTAAGGTYIDAAGRLCILVG